jgi:hypothetical protein
MLSKICRVCKLSKLESDFPTKGSISILNQCKDCKNSYARAYKKKESYKINSKAWRVLNKDKLNHKFREKYKKNPSINKNNVKKSKYKITIETFNQMLLNQEYRCKICNEHESNLNKILNIDHCHKTGKIRGLLCHKCNVLLGFARDNKDILLSAAKYIEDSST